VTLSALADADHPVPPVPAPLAWTESRRLLSTRSAVLMEAMDGAIALDAWIDVAAESARAAVIATLAAVSRAAEAMHRCGMAHGDLHWRNVIVRPPAEPDELSGAAEWWLIDGTHAVWATRATRIIEADRIADQAAWFLWLDLLKPNDAERTAVGAAFTGAAWAPPSGAWRSRVRFEMTRLARRERQKALRRMPRLAGQPPAA
jgi:hypothetical protein